MGLIRHEIEELEDSPIVEVWRLGYGKPEVIGMFAGEPDVPTPEFIRNAASKALAEGRTFYTPNRGIPGMGQAISDYLKNVYGVDVPESRIALTASGMSAVALIGQATVEAGDNVVTVTPSWPNIMRTMQIAGADIREVAMTAGNAGWQLDLDAVFAACDARTKLIYLASPGNPTGWMITREEAVKLLDFARARGIGILSDEVYHRTVYDRNAAFSFLEIARPDDPLFVVNSFSKAWAMTGWRIGWLEAPAALAPVIENLVQFTTSGVPVFTQRAAVAALSEGEPFLAAQIERCQRARDILCEGLLSTGRVRFFEPEAAFYLFFTIDGYPDSRALAFRLIDEAGVGAAPGSAFGPGGEGHLRICFARDPEQVAEATRRIVRWLKR